MADVEPKLDRRSHLVDVLPAGARGADESFPYLAFREEDCLRNANHIGMVTLRTPGEKRQVAVIGNLGGCNKQKIPYIGKVFLILLSLIPSKILHLFK